MSKIEKMSVMGIRSFGPEDGDRQVVQFFTPLTLILGPNGTGKTTIIECLKYITTGDMPPNTKGGAFVHDPKVAHESVVRAQVRLQLRDVTGKLLQVQRSMEATQKPKKIEMRTLDSVITRIGPDGQKVSINSKCLDFDREMVTALGVPKPVLDNVIFCHQEDSCWPLGEGKALKDKFDAIFASTRYTKVLDTMRKLKQEQDQKIKVFKEEIKYLKQSKDKASQLEGDLAELKSKFAASEDTVKKVNEQLQPVHDRLVRISDQYNEIYKVQTKIEKLKSEKGQLEKLIRDLQDNIENEFQGSTEELEKLLSDFANKVQDHKEILSQFEDHQEEVIKSMEKLNKEKSLLLVEVGKLEQEAEMHEDNIRKRDAQLRQLADEYRFEGFSQGSITEDRCRLFFDEVQQKLDDIASDIKKVKSDFEAKEQKVQQKIDEVRDKKTQLEQTQRHKRDQMDKNKNEIRQIKQRLSHMEASVGRRDHVTQDLKRAEHELMEAEKAINLDELRRDIMLFDKERRQLEVQMNELNSEMNRLHLQSNVRAQLDMLKKEKTSKEDGIRRMKAKHEESLTHLFGSVPATNIRGQLEDYISRQTESTRKCSSEMQKQKTQLSQRETERNLLIAQIRQKEEEAQGLEERILSVCGSQDFEEGFQAVQQKLSETQDQRGSLIGAQHFLKKYVKELEKESPCCPLCHREFDTDQEVRELVLELEKKLRLVPSKLQKAEEEMTEQQSRYDNITQLKPIKEQLAGIRERDLPNMKTRLQKVNEEIQHLKDVVQEKSEELAILESDEGMAKDMQPDIVLMDRSQGELRELEKKITAQSAQLMGEDPNRTLEMVIGEREDIQLKLDTVGRKLDHLRQKQTAHTDHVQGLRTSINQLQAEKLKIETELQERTKLEEKQAQLTSDNQEYEADIERAEEQLHPLESEVRRLRKEKEELTSAKEAAVEKDKDAMEEVRSKSNSVRVVSQNIKIYNQSGKRAKLEKSKERQKQIATSQGKLDEEQEELTANINKLRKDLAAQQIHEREMADNLMLRKKQEDIAELVKQIAELQERLGGLDPTSLERERQQLNKKEEDLKRELHKASGRQQGFEDQIKATERELNSDMFRDAARNFRNKMIDLRTTELGNGDLEKYYKAMDRAIMNYHVQKMAEINKIICELWRNTYRGHDIETIEIRSDEDESGIMKARRVYNYRVVMLKGDTALDMRGRCSAGQKVLASLIIRLALAETFCMNCGVFALDEPTTNLDRENIESLAHALVRIIETRNLQKNFQLVVITHDEDFVELLGRSNYADHFIKVYKDENGCSRLARKKVQDLHSG